MHAADIARDIKILHNLALKALRYVRGTFRTSIEGLPDIGAARSPRARDRCPVRGARLDLSGGDRTAAGQSGRQSTTGSVNDAENVFRRALWNRRSTNSSPSGWSKSSRCDGPHAVLIFYCGSESRR